VIVYLVDATADFIVAPLEEVAGLDAAPKAPLLLALNKCDLVNDVVRRDLARAHPGAQW
jgi:hypothetical protein